MSALKLRSRKQTLYDARDINLHRVATNETCAGTDRLSLHQNQPRHRHAYDAKFTTDSFTVF